MDNCVSTVKELLIKSEIPYTIKFLEQVILSHPDHPSLVCIKDTLEAYGIQSLAMKIGRESIDRIPCPCVVFLSEKGGLFRVITKVSSDSIFYSSDGNRPISMPMESFLEVWTGICLLIEITDTSGEPGIKERIQGRRLTKIFGLSILSLITIIFALSIQESSVASGSGLYLFGFYAILKLMGVLTGGVLLYYEIDRFNPVFKKLCHGGNQKINCDAVLQSKYAKILNGRITLSLLVFTYFFSTLMCLALSGFSSSAAFMVTKLSLIAFPMVILSAYFQGVIIKNWCRLCLIVQVILIFETAISFFGNFHFGVFRLTSFLILIVLTSVPLFIWPKLKSLLLSEKEMNSHKRELNRIKNNPKVFQSLLLKSHKIKTASDTIGISIIQDEARYNVLKVCNPFCGPCGKAHFILEELFERKQINLQIVFVSGTDENDLRRKPINYFLNIAEMGDQKYLRKVLSDWYGSEEREFKSFIKKHGVNENLKNQKQKMKAMNTWCAYQNIEYTPTIFINGYKLPLEYGVDDLVNVLI